MVNLAWLIQKGIGVRDAMALQKISRRLHRLDERACDGFASDQDSERHDARVAAVKRQAEKIAGYYGYIAYHQSDPRGWSLYLVNPEHLGTHAIDAVYDRGLAVSIW
jgi:hypothetical protein